MSAPSSAFGIRDFRLLTQSRFLLTFAVQMQAVVMGWQIYEIKHDPLYLGFVGLAEGIPALSLALFAGDIVDRRNPLKFYRAVLALSLVSAGILLALSLRPEWFGDTANARVMWIYVAALITGSARSFSGPSLYKLVPQIVPRHVLAVSSAWITSAFQLAAVSGPALAGGLYAWKSAWLPYGVDCGMLSLGLGSLYLLEHKPEIKPSGNAESAFRRLTSGMRYVFGHQLLLAALALDMFAVLFGGAVALLPIFASEILHTGPTGLGILRAAPSAGALLMSVWLIRSPIGKNAGRILLSVVAGFGLCMIGFGVSKAFWLSVALLALSGALDSVSMVVRGAIVQLCSPEEMRGRIAAVNSIFIGSSNEIGAFESGLTARLMGTVPSVVFGGTMTLLTVALAAWRAPKLRKMDLTKI